MATFAQLQSKVTPDVRDLFDFLWQFFLDEGRWPTEHEVHRLKLEERKLALLLKTSTGALVQKEREGYQLRMLGVLCTTPGPSYVKSLRKLLAFLRDVYYGPKRDSLSSEEIQAATQLNAYEIDALGKVLQHGGFFGIYSHFLAGGRGWQIATPYTSLKSLPKDGSIDADFEAALNALASQEWHIDHEKRSLHFAQRSANILDFGAEEYNDQRALRRYQVFVSSTYEDLIDARQHVIQALLDSRCIPAGMELFPAASVEQWKLIQDIIAESDYYLVVVAGRYGKSPPRSTLSYTEREFDFARKLKKPILGFFHASPGSIPRKFCEDDPARQKQLDRFVAKVKKRLCKSWTTPVDLGSAVKSAIQHAIIHDPQPGWVRVR